MASPASDDHYFSNDTGHVDIDNLQARETGRQVNNSNRVSLEELKRHYEQPTGTHHVRRVFSQIWNKLCSRLFTRERDNHETRFPYGRAARAYSDSTNREVQPERPAADIDESAIEADVQDLSINAKRLIQDPNALKVDSQLTAQGRDKFARGRTSNVSKQVKITNLLLSLLILTQGWTESASNASDLPWPTQLGVQDSMTDSSTRFMHTIVNTSVFCLALVACFFSGSIQTWSTRRTVIILSTILCVAAGTVIVVSTERSSGSTTSVWEPTWRILLGWRIVSRIGVGLGMAAIPTDGVETNSKLSRGHAFIIFDSLWILLGLAANIIAYHLVLYCSLFTLQIASPLIPAIALCFVLNCGPSAEPPRLHGNSSFATPKLQPNSTQAPRELFYASPSVRKAARVLITDREVKFEEYTSDQLQECQQPYQGQIKDNSREARTVLPGQDGGRRHPAQAAVKVLRALNLCFRLGGFTYFSKAKTFPESRYARIQATILAVLVFVEVIALSLMFVFVTESSGITLAERDDSLTRVLFTELDVDMNVKEGKASDEEKEYSILGTCDVSCQSVAGVQPIYLVSFTCACGTRITDRYTELRPGGIARLRSDLHNQRLRARRNIIGIGYECISANLCFPTFHKIVGVGGIKISAPTEHVAYPARAFLSNEFSSASTSTYTYTTSSNTNCPTKDAVSRKSILSGTTNPKTATTLRSSNLLSTILPSLLLCFPKHESGFKLHCEELPVNIIGNDRELFQLLRRAYLKRRNLTSFRRGLKTVTKLSFTAFDVDLNNYVDLKPHLPSCSSSTAQSCVLPPPTLLQPPNAAYSYEPITQDHCPPRGPAYMAHYFQHPEEVHEEQRYLLNQIPKHLRGQLAALSDAPVRGWGLSFEEGLNYWPLMILMLLPPLIFGIVWSICKRDIQSGFGVAAYCLAAETIVLMYLVSPTSKT